MSILKIAFILANLSIISCGIVLGWTSPMTSKLQNPNNNPLHVNINSQQEALIGSLAPIAGVFGPLYTGFLVHFFGRKIVLLSSAIPIIAGCILLAVAKSLLQVYIARILCGLAVGQLIVCVPMYVGEISETKIRGAMGSFLQIFLAIGFLFDYTVGPFTSYVEFNLICLIPIVAFTVTFIFMPETPNYFLEKGNEEKALKSLIWLRNGSHEKAQNELCHLHKAYSEKLGMKTAYFKEMKKKGNIKAFGLAVGLFFFQQFSGITAVKFYMQHLFQDSNTGVSPVLSTILVGCLQVLAACFTSSVIDRWGRRIMLMISSIGMTITLSLLGVYFYLLDIENSTISYLTWLPTTSVMIFVLMYSMGFGPVSFALLGELFDPSVKRVNISLISSLISFYSFVISGFTFKIQEAIGGYSVFWIFSSFAFLGLLFVYFFLPETKGKSLQEIQKILND